MAAKINIFHLLIFLFSTDSMTLQSKNEPVRILSYNILEGMYLDSSEGKSTFANWIKKMNQTF